MAWSQQFIDSLDRKAKTISYILKFLPPSKEYGLSFGDAHSLRTEIKIGSANVIDTVQITPSTMVCKLWRVQYRIEWRSAPCAEYVT